MLKRQKCFFLKDINDTSWLLPYGQAVADQKKGCELNETGTFIWQTLETPMSEDTLIAQVARHYEVTKDALPAVTEDLHHFIQEMLNMGFLSESLAPIGLPLCKILDIAGLHIGLYGVSDVFSDTFDAFCVSPQTESKDTVHYHKAVEMDQQIEAVLAAPPWCPPGNVLIQNRELTLYENEDGFCMRFPEMPNIFEARMTRDGRYVRLYGRQPLNSEESQHIFHAIRFFFLYLAGLHGLFAMHSASILYKEKAWLFSGPSGMGKSTHTTLWHELIGTPYLNGDLNLIGIKDGVYQVYGIPWCGTSELFTTKTCPLGGIVLLGRATDDHLETLDDATRTLRVMQRLISPSWTQAGLEANLNFAAGLTKKIPVYHLCCTKNPSAVHVIKATIDAEEAIYNA